MLQEEVAAYWRHHAGEYAEGDNSDVVWEALLVIAEQTPELFRDAVEAAAAAVGARCCTHVSIPGPLADTGSLGERRTAAQQHAGLCGKYHAEHIANIDLATIEERAGGAAISTKKMRNQVQKLRTKSGNCCCIVYVART